MIDKITRFYKRVFFDAEKYARYLGVTIGNDCRIATRFFGSEPYLINIGNHVQITKGVRFATHGAGWVFRSKYPTFDVFGKIVVGNNVYIGNNSIILPGVTVGDNVIIGAGSVVTKSILGGSIVGGNPAKVIGRINDLEERLLSYNVETKGLSSKDKRQLLLNLPDSKFIRK